MKLYIMPGACSFVPHTALEWSGVDYDLVKLNHDTVKSEDYLKVNPLGTVPAIVDGDTVISQNLAVQTYIDASYPDANIFGSDKSPAGKAGVMHWLSFINSDLHKAYMPIFAPQKFVADNEKELADLKQHAKENVVKLYGYPNEQLGKQDYLANEKTTADLYLYVTLRWAKGNDIDLSKYENFNDFIARIEADASVTEVLKQEGLDKIESL